MGLLDSNIKIGKSYSKEGTLSATASANSYLRFNSADIGNYGIDVSGSSVIAFQVKTMASGTTLYVKGWVTNGFNIKIYNADSGNLLDGNKITGTGTYVCDVSPFKGIGFYVGTTPENNTIEIDYLTKSIVDMSGMVEKNQYEKVIVSCDFSTTGTLVTIPSSDKNILAISVETESSELSISAGDLTIIDAEGHILKKISHSGTYFVESYGGSSVTLRNAEAVSGATGTITYQYVDGKPACFDLKPVQLIEKNTITLAAGDTSKQFFISQKNIAIKGIFKYFKFIQIIVRYFDSNNTLKNTSLTINAAVCGDNLYIGKQQTVGTMDNSSYTSTEWLSNSTDDYFIKFAFSSAAEGDKIYYEIHGVR